MTLVLLDLPLTGVFLMVEADSFLHSKVLLEEEVQSTGLLLEQERGHPVMAGAGETAVDLLEVRRAYFSDVFV